MEFLDFIDDDFLNLPSIQQIYKDNFEKQYSCFSRNFFMLQIINYLTHIKMQLYKNRRRQTKTEFSIKQFKNIKFDSSSQYVGKKMANQLRNIASELQQGEFFSQSNILSMIYASLREDIIKICVIFIFEAIFRMAVALFIILLLNTLNQQNYRTAYIMIILLVLFLYLQQLCKLQGLKQSRMLATRIKSGFLLLLLAKISKLSSYIIKSKSSQMATLTNLLASDIGVIENRLEYLMNSLSFPITIIGVTIIQIANVGWLGLVGVVLIILMIPLAKYVAKRNGAIIEAINVHKDRRIQLTVQIIQGIRFIKLNDWQLVFNKKIKQTRKQQMEQLKKLSFGRSLQKSMGNFIGYLIGLVILMLAHYVSIDKIGIDKIFIILSMINSLKVTLLNLAEGLGLFYQFKIIFGRFAKIINIKNISMQRIDQSSRINLNQNEVVCIKSQRKFEKEIVFQLMQNQLQTGEIIFKNFNGYWKTDFTMPFLKNLSLQFRKGIFYGITGGIGCGKSGLIGVILKQIPYYSGYFCLNGSVSYVEQEPFLFSVSIKQNILSGKDYQQQLYKRVLKDSCLESYLEIEEKIIGQKGAALSGGQKTLLSLARSLYAETQILLLDDPFSAVDSNLAKIIYENCLKKISKIKTVILVTQQINFLQNCDIVIILHEGSVISKGTPKQLEKQLNKLKKRKQIEQKQQTFKKINQQLVEKQINEMIFFIKDIKKQKAFQKQFSFKRKDLRMQLNTCSKQNLNQLTQEDQHLCQEQVHEKAVEVNYKTYTKYLFLNKINYILFPITILLFVFNQGIITVYFRLFASQSTTLFGADYLYWGILGALTGILSLVLVLKFYLLHLCLLNSNQKIHDKMILGILRSPISYFDRYPQGILINKFSNDLSVFDNSLAYSVIDAIQGSISSLVALINVCAINVYFVPPVTVILIITIIFYLYAKQTIISCKQLDLQNKSTIFNVYNQTVGGITQIQILKKRQKLISTFSQITNNCVTTTQAYYLTLIGFGFIASILALLLMTIGLMIGINIVDADSVGLYGVTIVSLMVFNQSYERFLQQIILTQSLMISCQRVFQIIDLQTEKQLKNQFDCQIEQVKQMETQKRQDYNKNCLINSGIQFKNLIASYKPNYSLVIKNISFQIKAKSKVGIIGRTGSGKSSILKAILRIIQPNQGSTYTIGNYDALSLNLHFLRQHISVISKNSFFFKGTIRQNIDPLGLASELQIWNALQKSKLVNHIKSFSNQLQTDMSNTSGSFSVGQKQLFRLARAFLQKNDILIFDQAIIDIETNNYIQSLIKQKFSDKTVINITNRIQSISDYDNIIVINDGQVVQNGSPFELILKQGIFCEMVMNQGNNVEDIIKKAKNSFKKKEKMIFQI